MTALMLATPYAATPDIDGAVSSDLSDFFPILNRLRFLAQTCRAEARLDLGTACAMINACSQTSLDTVAKAMIQVVSEAVEGRVTFLAPGSRDMSFDEEWLVRALERASAGDTVSVEFLLRRRVTPRNHHAFRSIIRVVGGLLER